MIKLYFLIGCLIFTYLSCRIEQSPTSGNASFGEKTFIPNSPPELKAADNGDERTVESYANDSRIGRAGQNKVQIDISELPGSDANYEASKRAMIKFYSRSTSKEWELKQTLEIESSALADTAPEFVDFNGDGLKDITFISNTAARGANEVRTLLIYDKANDVLIHVKNSEDYPNLAYNKTLNCIDAWLFHGATTTVFLKLEGDMLGEFASVDTGAELVVTVTGEDGNKRVIKREKMKEDDIYTRYRMYNPPRP